MSSPNATKARQRTYTTVGQGPPVPTRGGAASATGSAGQGSPTSPDDKKGTAPQPAKQQLKKMGIHPPPVDNSRECSCGANYLKNNFCIAATANVPMNFHERFYACVQCQRRPADHLCCKCWKGYCKQHAQEHYRAQPEHHVYANYELWQYEECFTCLKCNAYTLCEAFDHVLEPLFISKGSFVPVPVTEKHLDQFEDHGIRVGAGTMQGWRADNEDSHVIYLGLPNSGLDYFAVFDGHGGPLVARFAGRRTHEIFDTLCKSGGDPQALLTKTFILTDDTIGRETTAEETGSCGCTANVVVINHQTKKFYCANSGDARSVLCRAGKAINLSEDHRPTLETERNRILAAGSAVSDDDRVDGLLAVSRAFGDFDFKQANSLPAHKQAVTCVPDVSVHNLTPEDQFIVCACDGIWDCMTSTEVVDFVAAELKASNDPMKAAGKLLDRCVARELPEDGLGTDNMSVIVVLLK